MTMRILGALLLTAGCGGMGFSLVRSYKWEVRLLGGLLNALREMEWELKYRVTPLPELCRVGAFAARGQVRQVLEQLALRLEAGGVCHVSECMNALSSTPALPRRARDCLRQLGNSLGRFDLEGQLQGLQEAQRQCRGYLEELKEGGADRLRTCQTLAVCGGAALAILFI